MFSFRGRIGTFTLLVWGFPQKRQLLRQISLQKGYISTTSEMEMSILRTHFGALLHEIYVKMGMFWLTVWMLFVCFIGDAQPQYRDKNINDCPNCVDEHSSSLAASRWTMPLLKLGEKRYYLGIFFKANWYRASQYCRYHGMHLASIASQEENDRLEKHIKDFGLGHEHFWTSGTDQAEEGTFFWMANGRPITFENWNVGEPNNFRYENGEEEHCLELWNRDGKGLKWNDSPCSFETFFVCEVQ